MAVPAEMQIVPQLRSNRIGDQQPTCHPASLHLHGRLPLAAPPALLSVHPQPSMPSICSSLIPIPPSDCPAGCPRPPHDVLEVGELAGGAHHAHIVHLAQPLKRLVPLGAAICACAAGRARAGSTHDAGRGGAKPQAGPAEWQVGSRACMRWPSCSPPPLVPSVSDASSTPSL